MQSALEPYFKKWPLTPDGEAFEAGSSILIPVRTAAAPAFLKLFRIEDERKSPEVLAHYAGHGSVRAIAHDEGAVLLERAMPGTPLSALVRDGRDDEATGILCEVARKLHAKPSPAGTPRLADWADAFARYRRRQPHALLPSALLSEAEREFFELCRSQGPSVLLHGDLHHDNILFDEARGWLAIDPKGVAGEREFEPAMALKNPEGCEAFFCRPDIMLRRIDAMSDLLNLDRSRVLRWNFAQAMLSTLWMVEDGFPDEAIAHALSLVETARRLARP
jgi:streptomycin 6-kinase